MVIAYPLDAVIATPPLYWHSSLNVSLIGQQIEAWFTYDIKEANILLEIDVATKTADLLKGLCPDYLIMVQPIHYSKIKFLIDAIHQKIEEVSIMLDVEHRVKTFKKIKSNL